MGDVAYKIIRWALIIFALTLLANLALEGIKPWVPLPTKEELEAAA
mgnify:CR=1 FL=1